MLNIRLADLTVKPEKLEGFKQQLVDRDNNIAISVATEAGVLAMFLVADKAQDNRFYLMEVYRNQAAYEAHIKTTHFKTYAEFAKTMLLERQLIETVPVCLASKDLSQLSASNVPLVRVARPEIDVEKWQSYQTALCEEIVMSVNIEEGVLAIFAVAEKEVPYKLHLFEFYKDEAAYQAHLHSPHFVKYSELASQAVKTKHLLEVVPVQLRVKPDFQPKGDNND